MVPSILLKITFPEHIFIELGVNHLAWRQDTQHINTQHNDTQHNKISNGILSIATSSMIVVVVVRVCVFVCMHVCMFIE